jgi:hypothetical protein
MGVEDAVRVDRYVDVRLWRAPDRDGVRVLLAAVLGTDPGHLHADVRRPDLELPPDLRVVGLVRAVVDHEHVIREPGLSQHGQQAPPENGRVLVVAGNRDHGPEHVHGVPCGGPPRAVDGVEDGLPDEHQERDDVDRPEAGAFAVGDGSCGDRVLEPHAGATASSTAMTQATAGRERQAEGRATASWRTSRGARTTGSPARRESPRPPRSRPGPGGAGRASGTLSKGTMRTAGCRTAVATACSRARRSSSASPSCCAPVCDGGLSCRGLVNLSGRVRPSRGRILGPLPLPGPGGLGGSRLGRGGALSRDPRRDCTFPAAASASSPARWAA